MACIGKRTGALGGQQAVTMVHVGDHLTVGVADTRTRRTVINRELAQRGNARRTGRTGQMNMAGRSLIGQFMSVEISVADGSSKAMVEALVPDEGQPFRKGLVLGMDFLQAARMRIDAETGEAFCSACEPSGAPSKHTRSLR